MTRNLWHSCGYTTLDDWLSRLSPRGRAFYDRFEALIVVPGWWQHRLRITDPGQLDAEVQRWLRESYRLMGQRERLTDRVDQTRRVR